MALSPAKIKEVVSKKFGQTSLFVEHPTDSAYELSPNDSAPTSH